MGALLAPEKGHSPGMNRGTCENGKGHLLMGICRRKKGTHKILIKAFISLGFRRGIYETGK